MANKQINELTEKSTILSDNDLILVYDSEETGSEKAKKVAISNYVAIVQSPIDVYVATTGNDTTGDGTSGNPWATLAKAVSWSDSKYISGNGSITINIADGTYNGNDSIYINSPCSNRIKIIGNTTTPANVIFNFNSGIIGLGIYYGTLRIQGVKLVGNNKATNEWGLFSTQNGHIDAYKVILDNWHSGAYITYGSASLNACTINNNIYGVQSQLGTIALQGSCSVTNNSTAGLRSIWAGRIASSGSSFSGNGNNSVTATDGTITIF